MESNNKAVLDMIARYKAHVREHGMTDELYKWELIQRFKGRPDPDAPDLLREFSEVSFGNLLYQMAMATTRHLASAVPEEFRACLKILFDESQPIAQRLPKYISETLHVYRTIVPEARFGSHHDERTAGVLLAYHFPDRYAIYKDSFYKKFCKLLGIPHRKKGSKLFHFQELVKELIDKFISKDQELLDLTKRNLNENCYPDPAHFLLAQNILYMVLDQGKGIELQDPDEDDEPLAENTMKTEHPLNTILYGPPGTGKTYHTISKALEIMGVDTSDMDRIWQKQEFQKLQEAGRIAFVTFHQSMSYEDFVEGIKPILDMEDETAGIRYQIAKGVFLKLGDEAKRKTGNYKEVIESFKSEVSEIDGKQPVTINAPGTTFKVKYKGFKTLYISPQNSVKADSWYPVSLAHIEKYYESGSLEGTYNGTYVKGIVEFLFKNRGLAKGEMMDNTLLPHLLIIDEINRGNVSQIFGELITLIEEDKQARRQFGGPYRDPTLLQGDLFSAQKPLHHRHDEHG